MKSTNPLKQMAAVTEDFSPDSDSPQPTQTKKQRQAKKAVTDVTAVTENKRPTSSAKEGARPVTKRASSPVTDVTRFERADDGLYYREQKDDGDSNPVWVCSPIDILAATCSAESEDWGRLIQIEDQRGTKKEWTMPMSMLSGSGEDYRKHLLSLGLRIGAGQRAQRLLHTFISIANPDKIIRCVSKSGWHDSRFVLADGSVCGDGEELRLQSEFQSSSGISTKGDLSGWTETVAKQCAGNTRLLFAVCASFAAALLRPCRLESGGINFYGGSSIGKTTVLRVAASVFGSSSFVKSCRATTNGIEALAVTHNDLPLILDELGQSDAQQIGDIVYLLANGRGKERATKYGSSRPSDDWRLLFLMSGERNLSTHMESAGLRTMAGQEARLLSVAADTGKHGAFEKIHRAKDGAAFSKALTAACAQNHGTAGVAFLSQLCGELDLIEAQYHEFQMTFHQMVLPQSTLERSVAGQVRRVLDRCALIAFAGETATRYGITGWVKNEATDAAASIFQQWLTQRGGYGGQEETQLIDQVSEFFERHGESRFKTDGEDRIVHNQAGYRRHDDLGGVDFYCSSEVFKREIIKGFSPAWAIDVLVRKGFLQLGHDGSPNRVYKFEKKSLRAYRVRISEPNLD